jgi:hypothetical protein
MGTLSYGDNLDILRRYLTDVSVDLLHPDPQTVMPPGTRPRGC